MHPRPLLVPVCVLTIMAASGVDGVWATKNTWPDWLVTLALYNMQVSLCKYAIVSLVQIKVGAVNLVN